jgi:signal transduction histidine kinase
MTRSMRARLTLAFVLILAPFVVATSHILFISHRTTREDRVKMVSRAAFEKSLAVLETHHWQASLTHLFSNEEIRDLRVGALVADSSGRVIWRSPADAPAWPQGENKRLIRGKRGDLEFVLNVPQVLPDHDNSLQQLIIFTTTVVLVFAGAAWLLVGKALSPIGKLARQAAVASAEDAETKLVSPSQDSEMEELVTTLNDFLGRIRETSEVRSRFYAAASHELRTPLQALTGHLEVALGQPRTAKEYRTTIQEAAVQSQRLVSLVEGILLLYQLQGGAATPAEAVRVDEEVETTLQSLQPLMEARRLRLCEEIAKPAPVLAVPAYVAVLVRNLLENAAKYGREGGNLDVFLGPCEGTLTLRIENDAPDGSQIDVDRLFEPFYRLDASRSTKSGGNGLGLAICQAAAKANGWNLTLCQDGARIVAFVFDGLNVRKAYQRMFLTLSLVRDQPVNLRGY